MPRVKTLPMPAASHLWTLVQDGDFIDGYAVRSDLTPSMAAQVGLSLPRWASVLLSLRNKIVAPLGLKTDTNADSPIPDDYIFPTTHETDQECIVGTDDSHLNFRIAVRREGEMIHMATWVHRNNLLGRVYLMVVMPFHILIVRDAMRRIARHGAPTPIASPTASD